MSFGFLLLAFAAALNPCRTRLGMPRRREALLLDSLDVSPESFRLAAGLVLTLEGLRALVLPRPAAEPELPQLGAALVPVAFPLLLQPGVVVLALAAGGEGVAGEAIGALAAALVLVGLAGSLPTGPRAEALLAAGGRLFGALEIAVGAALAVDAIKDV
jgi:small neutral amino acid transporter SnatA (MarC family)